MSDDEQMIQIARLAIRMLAFHADTKDAIRRDADRTICHSREQAAFQRLDLAISKLPNAVRQAAMKAGR